MTVEASSHVLIEKVRATVTDGEGQYRIIDLRPGMYAITFTLPGFNTSAREGLELPASFTATVNIDMRVGELSETVVVTGESPVVDVRSAQTTQVLSREVWDTLPSSRNVQAVAQLMPGVRMNSLRRGRLAGDAAAAVPGARHQWREQHRLVRRDEPEFAAWRWRDRPVLQRCDRRGIQLSGGRARRRHHGGRRPRERHSEGRRESVQRFGIRGV